MLERKNAVLLVHFQRISNFNPLLLEDRSTYASDSARADGS